MRLFPTVLVAPVLVVTALTATACVNRTEPLVICHNSNCEEPPDPSSDDTLEAMEASLSLVRDDGAPLVDGIELDLFWFGEEDVCLYAHDLSHGSDVPTAAEGIAALIDVLQNRDTSRLTRKEGAVFQVFLELKGHVGESKSDKHSDEQRAAHAACALDGVEQLEDAANENGWSLAVTLNSFDPLLIQALNQDGRIDALRSRDQVRVRLGGLFGVPAPLDSQTLPLSEWPDSLNLDMASVHPHWIRQGHLEVFDSRGYDVAFWMFTQVPETLASIERYEPEWMVTNESITIDRWLRR